MSKESCSCGHMQNTYIESESGELLGCTIKEYRKCVLSTQGGKSGGRASMSCSACSGFAANVDTAHITAK